MRKAKATPITPEEREIVSAGIRRYAGLEHFLVDVCGKDMVVYLPHIEERRADGLLGILGDSFAHSDWAATARRTIIRHSPFSKMMRFQLVNAKQRLFSVQRWCFRGSIDDWIYLAGPALLDQLVREYVPHLSTDDFFEMF